jgi:hypothetical protein
MTYILARAEQIVRKKITRLVKERMRWPNPNPEGELEDAWDAYEDAYARHFIGAPSLTGLCTADELAQAWERLCDAVMTENKMSVWQEEDGWSAA